MSEKRAGQAFLFFTLVQTAGSVAYAMAARVEPVVAGTLFAFLFSELLLFLPFLAAALLTPAAFRDMFPFRRVRGLTILLTVLATILLYPAMAAVNIISLFFSSSGGAAIGAEALKMPFGISFLFIAVIGPLMEEMAFRGYLFGSLGAGGRRTAAAFLSALLFGLAHGNINQACYAFLMGIYLAFLSDACGSILPGFLAHAGINAVGVCMMYVAGEAAMEAGSGMSVIDILQAQGVSTYGQWAAIVAVLVILVIVAALFCALSFLLIRVIRHAEGRGKAPAGSMDSTVPQAAPADRQLLSVPLVIGIIIMAAITFGLHRTLSSFVQNL